MRTQDRTMRREIKWWVVNFILGCGFNLLLNAKYEVYIDMWQWWLAVVVMALFIAPIEIGIDMWIDMKQGLFQKRG